MQYFVVYRAEFYEEYEIFNDVISVTSKITTKSHIRYIEDLLQNELKDCIDVTLLNFILIKENDNKWI